jgi:tRNA(Ile)-lysidine synthase
LHQSLQTSHPLVAQVREALLVLGRASDRCVVAISGGPDSVALLHVLVTLQREQPGNILVIAHLNHTLRGEESDADETFVRSLYHRLAAAGHSDLRFRSDREDVATYAHKNQLNLENAGREVRYRWLEAVARDEGASTIATGHTADDQAETVLHHILRGTGLRGLRGIAAKRELAPGIHLIRPMLMVPRKRVLEFLQFQGEAFREDSSNLDLSFTRNRIRHELLPFLDQNYNPAIAQVLARLAAEAVPLVERGDEDAARLLAAAELPRARNLVILDRAVLSAAGPERIRQAVRRVWSREGWSLGDMTFEHWDRLASAVFGKVPALEFPGGIRACFRQRVVQLGPRP